MGGLDVEWLRPARGRQAATRMADALIAPGPGRPTPAARLGLAPELLHRRCGPATPPSPASPSTTHDPRALPGRGEPPRRDAPGEEAGHRSGRRDLLQLPRHRGRPRPAVRNIDADRVVVTPLGVTRREPRGRPAPFGGAPYLLYVGERRPSYKNWQVLLGAVREAGPDDPAGLLPGHRASPTTSRRPAERSLADRVRFVGERRCASWPAGTTSAAGFVYPSRYEGVRVAAARGDEPRAARWWRPGSGPSRRSPVTPRCWSSRRWPTWPPASSRCCGAVPRSTSCAGSGRNGRPATTWQAHRRRHPRRLSPGAGLTPVAPTRRIGPLCRRALGSPSARPLARSLQKGGHTGDDGHTRTHSASPRSSADHRPDRVRPKASRRPCRRSANSATRGEGAWGSAAVAAFGAYLGEGGRTIVQKARSQVTFCTTVGSTAQKGVTPATTATPEPAPPRRALLPTIDLIEPVPIPVHRRRQGCRLARQGACGSAAVAFGNTWVRSGRTIVQKRALRSPLRRTSSTAPERGSHRRRRPHQNRARFAALFCRPSTRSSPSQGPTSAMPTECEQRDKGRRCVRLSRRCRFGAYLGEGGRMAVQSALSGHLLHDRWLDHSRKGVTPATTATPEPGPLRRALLPTIDPIEPVPIPDVGRADEVRTARQGACGSAAVAASARTWVRAGAWLCRRRALKSPSAQRSAPYPPIALGSTRRFGGDDRVVPSRRHPGGGAAGLGPSSANGGPRWSTTALSSGCTAATSQ